MQTTTLGSTELEVSVLGLGTVELGMPYGLGRVSPPDDADCIRLLQRAADHGVNYIDTAAAYGRSEELIGRAFASDSRPVIATKVSLRDPDGTAWKSSRMGDEMRTSIDRSRRLLGVDRIDLVQIHNAEAIVTGDTALLDAMESELLAGNVANWGASTYGAGEAMAVVARGVPLRTLQVAYSVLDRTLEEDVFPAATQAGIGLIFRSVFLQGVLSERRHSLHADLLPLRQVADAVAQIASDLGQSLPMVALRFAMFEAAAQVTLVGTADATELDANVDAALAGPLPKDVVTALRAIGISDQRLLNPGNWPAS